jgi:hypothetical protein
VYNPSYNADLRVQTKKNRAGGTYTMMSVTRTLPLAAVASVIMASVPVAVTGSAAAGPAGSGTRRVTRFVCAHCTSTGELSHHGMFLNQASILRHIAAIKPCREANLGILEIQLEARAGDVMAGAVCIRFRVTVRIPGSCTFCQMFYTRMYAHIPAYTDVYFNILAYTQ